jgi:hypothetical protein
VSIIGTTRSKRVEISVPRGGWGREREMREEREREKRGRERGREREGER